MAKSEVYILMGSNLGDREKNLAAALERMRVAPGIEVIATSGIYVTEARDMEGENPQFMNQVVKIDYDYLPGELLNSLETTERALGRTDKGRRRPRTIDLDILLFGNEIIETDDLCIPHRELLNRPFAMVPLLQIDPEIIHPVTGQPVSEYLSTEDADSVLLYKDHVSRHI